MKKLETIGKYKVIDILGKGAMGIVYRALDPDINREVAIKTIRFDTVIDETGKNETLKRFMREAQAVGKLEHPNIATIYDVSREQDQTNIVMQLIDGKSLKDIIESGKKFTVPEVLSLMESLAEALGYAHEQGIVHRDVKPANILVDKKGKPHLVDFGVARLEKSTMTSVGAIVGTPSYMAPEQVMGKKVDARADIFSLGVILYECLTQRRPFEGDHITTVVYKIAHEEPPALSDLEGGISEFLEPVVKKALAKRPEDRYQTCDEFFNDLHKCSLPLSAVETMVLDTQKIEKKKPGKPRYLVPALILLVVLAGAYFFIPGVKQLFRSSPEVIQPLEARIIPEESGILESRSFQYPPKPVAKKIDPNAARIAQLLSAGKRSYAEGEYERCRQNMNEILSLSDGHNEARQYLNRANSAIASIREIKRIIEQEKWAEEEKEMGLLLSFLGDKNSNRQLYQRREAEARNFFNTYDNISAEVDINKVNIIFDGLNNATVMFPKRITAVNQRTGRREECFMGEIIWKMKKQGNSWIIIDYRKESN